MNNLHNLRLEPYLARGGGGGSSSGGGGGGGGFSSGSSYSSSSSGDSSGSSSPVAVIFFLIIFFGVIILFIYLAAKSKVSSLGLPPGFKDPLTDPKAEPAKKQAATRGREVFDQFQAAWSTFDLDSMKNVTSNEFYKKMVLELNVLKNYQRQDKMDGTVILNFLIEEATFSADGFTAYVRAKANDKLIDLRENKQLFIDSSVFSEYWHFVRRGNQYVLDHIDQTTASAAKKNSTIESFASQNGFYYDIDFGWLMMPSRGAIFGPAGFGNADINNHVIGYHKDKIVEFYTYEPKAGAGMAPILVAQAILPKRYDDILVTEKSWYNFKPKQKGLIKIETESVDFNKKFSVWAADADKATSFELLATNFMERIYALEQEINIEVVDNVLYLYAPDTNVAYDQLLQILGWAFDEMKL